MQNSSITYYRRERKLLSFKKTQRKNNGKICRYYQPIPNSFSLLQEGINYFVCAYITSQRPNFFLHSTRYQITWFLTYCRKYNRSSRQRCPPIIFLKRTYLKCQHLYLSILVQLICLIFLEGRESNLSSDSIIYYHFSNCNTGETETKKNCKTSQYYF